MAKATEKTNAARRLDALKIPYKEYIYGDGEAMSGAQIAEMLGKNPETVFKTLVTVGRSGTHYVFMIPVLAELDLKKAAALTGEKSVEMIKSKELLPLTGYIHGGCSPIGMKKYFRTFIHFTAKNFDAICFSGGRIGCQLETGLDKLKLAVKIEEGDLIK